MDANSYAPSSHRLRPVAVRLPSRSYCIHEPERVLQTHFPLFQESEFACHVAFVGPCLVIRKSSGNVTCLGFIHVRELFGCQLQECCDSRCAQVYQSVINVKKHALDGSGGRSIQGVMYFVHEIGVSRYREAPKVRRRFRLESRPRISMDSNNGGETRLPETATRAGPKA